MHSKFLIHESQTGDDTTPAEARALAAELSRRGFPAEYSPTPVRLVGEIMTAAGVRVAMSDADFLAAWQSVPSL